MQRRLYFLLKDTKVANEVFDKLLLARISDKHTHFLAHESVHLGELPEATVFQKSDIIHSLFVGLILGALVGIVAGFIGHGLLNTSIGGAMLATTLIGAVIGAWSSSMIGMMVPNRMLNQFYPAINERKEILAIIDVPFNKVEKVKEVIHSAVPSAHFKGLAPNVPAVP